jgi:hypothetical protein
MRTIRDPANDGNRRVRVVTTPPPAEAARRGLLGRESERIETLFFPIALTARFRVACGVRVAIDLEPAVGAIVNANVERFWNALSALWVAADDAGTAWPHFVQRHSVPHSRSKSILAISGAHTASRALTASPSPKWRAT